MEKNWESNFQAGEKKCHDGRSLKKISEFLKRKYASKKMSGRSRKRNNFGHVSGSLVCSVVGAFRGLKRKTTDC